MPASKNLFKPFEREPSTRTLPACVQRQSRCFAKQSEREFSRSRGAPPRTLEAPVASVLARSRDSPVLRDDERGGDKKMRPIRFFTDCSPYKGERQPSSGRLVSWARDDAQERTRKIARQRRAHQKQPLRFALSDASHSWRRGYGRVVLPISGRATAHDGYRA